MKASLRPKQKQHPNSLANLNPAKKGEVRNPKGNPGKRTLPDLKELIAEMVSDDDWRKLVAIIHKKAKTNPVWTNLLMDRAYGKPVAFIDTNANAQPVINIEHVVISVDQAKEELDTSEGTRPLLTKEEEVKIKELKDSQQD